MRMNGSADVCVCATSNERNLTFEQWNEQMSVILEISHQNLGKNLLLTIPVRNRADWTEIYNN